MLFYPLHFTPLRPTECTKYGIFTGFLSVFTRNTIPVAFSPLPGVFKARSLGHNHRPTYTFQGIQKPPSASRAVGKKLSASLEAGAALALVPLIFEVLHKTRVPLAL